MLDELIPQFAEHKEEAGRLKKLCDLENAQIKDEMAGQGLKKYKAGGYTATYIEANKVTINEDKLLALLKSKLSKKELKELKIIRTVEQVDENALENAIYNKLIPESLIAEMDGCQDHSTTVSLRITKSKEDK